MPETSLWFKLEVTANRFPRKTGYVFFGAELAFAELQRRPNRWPAC